MNCQTCQFEIEELELNEGLSGEARAHLSVCPVCRAFHDERQALKRLVGCLEAVSAPHDFDFRLRARLAAAKETGNRRFSWRSFVSSAPAIALAASFTLLIAGFVFYKQLKSVEVAGNGAGEIARREPALNPAPMGDNRGLETPTVNDPTEVSQPGKQDEALSATLATGVNSGSFGPAVVRKNPARRKPRQLDSGQQQEILTNETAVRAAEQIVARGASPLNTTARGIVELPVRSAAQPMRVFVDDRDGAKRTLTLEPVIFGSQDFTGRERPSIASSQGIW
jgi:hypothetical protein